MKENGPAAGDYAMAPGQQLEAQVDVFAAVTIAFGKAAHALESPTLHEHAGGGDCRALLVHAQMLV